MRASVRRSAGVTLAVVPSITTGIWREDIRPTSIWAGNLSAAGDPDYPIELEIYDGNWGVLRTEYAVKFDACSTE